MMNKRMVVVADADGIIAQTNPDDAMHGDAVVISKKLAEMNAQVIYPATMIAEATAHMQRVLNSTVSAYGTAVLLSGPSMQVAEVGQQTIVRALGYYSPTTSKKNTLFDCIVAAVAQEYHADAIFSFDHFYKSKGFRLAGELIP
jgi:predicted nucleic acid-binding protein